MPRTGWGIKPLTGTRIPRSMIILAARSNLVGTETAGYRESWRCASVEYSHNWPYEERQRDFADPTPERLWIDVSAAAMARRSTYLWAYDLSATLRVTDALRWLPELGWTLTAFSLNPGAPWMAWKRAGHTMKMVDVSSIWSGGIGTVGQLFGLARRPIEPTETNALAWLATARADREILGKAVYTYVEWIRREELGNLAVTGNGQAWSAFRRRFLTHGVLVHDDQGLHEVERTAMWTGRCEAYWHGSLGVVNVSEWDFSKAHTRLARDLALPAYPYDEWPRDSDPHQLLHDHRYVALAEVEVEVTEPIVPARIGDHMAWPVGRFTTTLWQPELQLLMEADAIVRVVRAWRYTTAPVLHDWADWILKQLDAPDDQVPAWMKEILRKWGNVLVGRFAMRYPSWEEIGQPSESDAFCMPYLNIDTGEESMLMQVGRTLWLQQGTDSPHDSAPAITGYVMSAMRAKLWRAMRRLPPHTLLYVDTDSMLVADRDNAIMESLAATADGDGLRLKSSWDGVSIYGPRQLVTGTRVKVSGVPKSARRTGRNTWEGETTESLTTALAGRSADAVRSTATRWVLEGTDVRRHSPGFGWTSPFEVGRETVTPGPTAQAAAESWAEGQNVSQQP